MHPAFVIGASSLPAPFLAAAAEPADWQTPLALLVTAIAAASLLIPAWRKRRRASSGGCASGDEGCGCSAVKKNLHVK